MAINSLKNKTFFLLQIVCFFAFFSTQAPADTEAETGITGKEKAVIAFFHLGKKAPDYEYWIKSGALYKTTPETYQEDILIKEWLRLDRGYGLYEVDQDLLEISALIVVHYTKPTEDKPARFYFSFPNRREDYIPVFSYPYGYEWVSMIINGLSVFADVPLTNAQYEAIKEILPEENDFYEAQLVIRVRPAQADMSGPIDMAGEKHWIMTGNIAYIKCEAEDEAGELKVLWDYVAPWHEEQFRQDQIPEEEKYPHPYDLFKN